jgi:hypothetical protein
MAKARFGAIGAVLLVACGSGSAGSSDPAGTSFTEPPLAGGPPLGSQPPSPDSPPSAPGVPGGGGTPGGGGGGGQGGGGPTCIPACESALQRCEVDAESSCDAICALLNAEQVKCLSLPCEVIEECIDDAGGTGGTGGTGGGSGGSGGGGNLDCMTVCTDCGGGGDCGGLCAALAPTQEELQCVIDTGCNFEACCSLG